MSQLARLCGMFSVACLIACVPPVSAGEGDDWVTLFDGETLAGWRPNSKPEAWSVVDGAIRAHGVSGASHLYYVGDGESPVPFRDFELAVVARAIGPSNSGIYFHTDEELMPGRPWPANGYEVQVNNTEKEKKKTGSLYGVVNLAASPVDEQEWFELRVVVDGDRIRVFADGTEVVDYTEPADVVRDRQKGRILRDAGGAIALQAHDPVSVVEFRSVKIRALD
ncbi:MAG: DUF1080 domain-containing protein [Planctomycetota bacterium]